MGNDVLGNPQIVPVYWGDTIRNDPSLRQAFDQFFCELLNSDFVGRLTQYGVNAPIVRPSAVVAGNVTSVSASDVGNNLPTWFQSNTVPAPSPLGNAANWLYVIVAPPNATVGGPGECGFHSSSTIKVASTTIDLAWALIFFPAPAAGEPAQNVINSVAYCLGHEVVEACSNPRGAGWSVNVPATATDQGQNCEIGDLCETKAFHSIGRWYVEAYWSNVDDQCVAGFGRSWSSLGAPSVGLLGAPVVGTNEDGRLELFATGRDGSVQHRWQRPPHGWWGGWGTLAAPATLAAGPPMVARNADGHLEVFGMQSAGVLWHVWQTAPNSGWSAGGSLGQPGTGIVGRTCVGANADGRLEVFAVGQDHQLHHIWQTTPNGLWSGWGTLGAPPPGLAVGDPRVVSNEDGRLEVFLLAQDGQVWHIWQIAPNGVWSSWGSLGQPGVAIANGAPFVGRNGDGRLELFATGANGNIFHVWQTAPNNGWSGWSELRAPLTIELSGLGALANNADGAFQVFTIGAGGALWTIAQTVPSNGWGTWRFLDGAPPAHALDGDQVPAAATNVDGELEVFVLGADDDVWTLRQTSAGGPWGRMLTS